MSTHCEGKTFIKKAVYIIKSESGDVLYVGQSSQIGKRLQEHHLGFGHKITVIECEDDTDRMLLEKKLIDALNPKYNNNLEGLLNLDNLLLDDEYKDILCNENIGDI